jgi:hypothetical protein
LFYTVGIYYYQKGEDFVKYAEQMIVKNIRVSNEFYVAPVYNEMILDSKKIIVKNCDEMIKLGINAHLIKLDGKDPSDDKLFINSNDIQNRIRLDPKIVIDLIDSFDLNKLAKFMFKTYRNHNVLIDQDVSNYQISPIPFDDLCFYQREKCTQYEGSLFYKEPYYSSYFALGNISTINGQSIINFSNKANETSVKILEFTNGRF